MSDSSAPESSVMACRAVEERALTLLLMSWKSAISTSELPSMLALMLSISEAMAWTEL